MNTYLVTFCYTVTVECADEDEAYELGYTEFSEQLPSLRPRDFGQTDAECVEEN